MIDIHSHIIFGVDDGPDTLEESLELLAEAYAQGVRQVVATSHRRKGMFETPEEVISAHFQEVKVAAAERLPALTLHYGGELYYTSDVLDKLEQGIFPKMADTRFVLVEFSGKTPYKDIHHAVTNIQLLGLTPIIAHIERYDALAFHEKQVRELISMGTYMQVNSSSVLKPKLFGDAGKLYKKRARYFLDKNLVHCVASDMHNLDNRKPYMADAYRYLTKSYGSDRARTLMITNPQILLDNTYI